MQFKTLNEQIQSEIRQKVTLTLPLSLVARINEFAPGRKRNQFIIQAIQKQLALEEQVAVLEETAGAWSDESHPELSDNEAIERWVRTLRTAGDRNLE